MLGWTLKIIFISIILIFTIHSTINYLKNTLTVPKVKDLVNIQKYENIYKVINKEVDNDDNNNNNVYTIDELLPKPDNMNDDMKRELKNFFKKKLKNNTTLGNNY